MGPQLLLDKSTLQSLSYDETWTVARHYYLVHSPILFIEILGDLKKHADDESRSKQLVATIADKIQPGNSVFSPHFRTLLVGNLMGNYVENEGRPVLLGGHDIVDSTGRRGVFFDEEPEREALCRWIKGEFLDAEHLLSERWREATRSIDLESWRRAHPGPAAISSLADVKVEALKLCRDPKRQVENLQFLVREAAIPQKQASLIFGYWLMRGMPLLEECAPYAFYCLSVYMTFYLGLANQLIGSKPTNRVDLEYVLYLPFCRVFVSTDRFHRSFAPLFTKPDQDFVNGQDFKEDIGRINQHWQALPGEEQARYREQNGNHPPDWPDSLTNRIWSKHMRPRAEYKPLKLTPELEKSLMEHLRPIMDEINRIRPSND